MYDFLLVGAGLFNSVFAYEATQRGYKCKVVERRDHIGGNCFTYKDDDIIVHKYGAHIFRTSEKKIWDYINKFAEFNNFINSPIARYKDEVYNMPFNMNTFSKMWGIATPDEAKKIIEKQSLVIRKEPQNLEEHVVKMVGTDIYKKLVKGYTEKQWGRPCTELPISIMRRIPLRFIYDNNYFNDRYQGIPIGGYTPIMDKMLEKTDIVCNIDYIEHREQLNREAKIVIYTGAIDQFFGFEYGPLEYRSLRFETEKIATDNYQGVAVVNYTDKETPYTRIIEHKHFEFGKQSNTIISREYPLEWSLGIEPYYPINDDKNTEKYNMYLSHAKKEKNVIFGGRLGEYKYYDMQDTIQSALNLTNKIL